VTGGIGIGGGMFVAGGITTNGVPSSSQAGWSMGATVSGSAGATTANTSIMFFINGNGIVGAINTNGSNTVYNTTSDARLKKDLKAFSGGEIIDRLQVWDFAWKAGGRGVGVIAQEAYKVFPDAISPPADEDGKWGADYSKFVPVLIADAQETHARLSALEKRAGVGG
jgi:hypothetical protein